MRVSYGLFIFQGGFSLRISSARAQSQHRPYKNSIQMTCFFPVLPMKKTKSRPSVRSFARSFPCNTAYKSHLNLTNCCSCYLCPRWRFSTHPSSSCMRKIRLRDEEGEKVAAINNNRRNWYQKQMPSNRSPSQVHSEWPCCGFAWCGGY